MIRDAVKAAQIEAMKAKARTQTRSNNMKQITLENILDCLTNMEHEVTIEESVRIRAKAAIDAMLDLPKMASPLAFETGLKPMEIEVISPS